MKILTILGSPKKKGNTGTVLSLFEKEVEAKHDVEKIHITQYKIGGCLGCYKCQEKKDEPGCVQKDDAHLIFDKMMNADAIVYASPLYCWSFTAQMKPLIDRHFCLVSDFDTLDHSSLIEGKAAALLVTCAGPIEGNCDAIRSIFTGLSAYAKTLHKGNFILPFCTAPDELGDEAGALAANLARAITA
jgi:multimeric flavodoxin WrbA